MDNRALFEWSFEHAAEALVVIGHEGGVLFMNRAARELPGVDLAAFFAVRGKDVDVARFRAEVQAGARAKADVRLDGEAGRDRRLELEGRGEGDYGVVAVRDVTECRRLEEELHQLRRAESIGYLTASLAHDFNNLLMVISSASAVLATGVQERDQLTELAHEIQLASDRATGMVRQLLSRIRRAPRPPQPIQPNAVITELRPLLERLVGDGVQIALSCDPSVGEAVADGDAFEHALLNLAANARDAMPRGGRLTVATGNVTLGDEEQGVAPGRYVAVTVTDTGVGMTREVRDRMFDRLFTTKDAARGSGMGMAMVRRFAMQSGGCVSVHSAPGQGTTVAIYLPRSGPAGRGPREPS